MRLAATRSSTAIGDPPLVRSIWLSVQNRPLSSARSRHVHRIDTAHQNQRSVASSNGAYVCSRRSGSQHTIGTAQSASTSPPSPACTSKSSKQRSNGRRRGDPSTPCANAAEGQGRRPAPRRNDRCHGRSCGGSPGRRRPWWPRTAALVAPRRPRTLRPTSPSLPQQCPEQQTNDSQNGGSHHHVVGWLGDELAIRVETHHTSIVPFPWKPSRSPGHRASSRSP